MLSAWNAAVLIDDAALVVSELVTNAYTHAATGHSYELELAMTDDSVTIGLADGSSIKPIVEQVDHARPRGRGMQLVETLASAWGADDHEGGKRVWVRLDVPAGTAAAENIVERAE